MQLITPNSAVTMSRCQSIRAVGMDDHSFVQLGPFEDDISDPLAILVQSLAHVYAAMTPNQNMQIATVILNQHTPSARRAQPNR